MVRARDIFYRCQRYARTLGGFQRWGYINGHKDMSIRALNLPGVTIKATGHSKEVEVVSDNFTLHAWNAEDITIEGNRSEFLSLLDALSDDYAVEKKKRI